MAAQQALSPTTDATSVASKFMRLDAALNAEIVERRVQIWGALLALVAGQMYWIKGDPGTAKTMLALRLRDYISGGTFFDVTMNSLTQPEELFGPISLKAMEDGRWERLIEATLVTADWGMIDEIFKAGRVLNVLLRLINEGTYKHGTRLIKSPLKVLFCASNEMPQGDDLNALYDRLLLRFEAKPIQDPQNMVRVLSSQIGTPEPILTWNEVLLAQSAAERVIVPPEVFEAVVEIRRNLHSQQITPSDRRFRRSMTLVQAAAWLDQCDTADIEHLGVLEHSLWEHPDQIAEVSRTVLKVANPLDNAILDMLASVEDLRREFERDRKLTNPDDRLFAGNGMHDKMKRAHDDYKALERRAGKNKGRNKRLGEVRSKLSPLIQEMCTEFFDASPDRAADVARLHLEGGS